MPRHAVASEFHRNATRLAPIPIRVVSVTPASTEIKLVEPGRSDDRQEHPHQAAQ
jgi:hypothetical protein